jgi:hypothetical protein
VGALVALWLGCAGAFADDWNFRVYELTSARRTAGLACVGRFYREGGDGLCPTLYREPLDARLVRARERDLSFYRKLRAQGAVP